MTFEEARGGHARLMAAWTAGQLTPEQFSAALAQLRVVDDTGAWWQIDASGAWLRWNGAAWVAASPPPPPVAPWAAPAAPAPWSAASSPSEGAAVVAPPSPAAPASPARAPEGTIDVKKALAEIGQRTLSPEAFVREARDVPLGKRSQAWFDLASILGGALSGYVWFVYGSVRGMPLPKVFSTGGRESWFDLVPTGLLVALPILAFVFRGSLLSRVQTLYGRVMSMSTNARLVGIAALGGAAWWFQHDTWLFQQREGLDFITPLLMVALPAGLAWFRPQVDVLLRPLQPLRQRVPRAMLVGIGLAVPYAVAWVLYGMGWNQYPYLRTTVAVGTLLSYAVVRTPTPLAPVARLSTGAVVGSVVSLLLLALIDPALADDFLRDPFNLNDGLRTNNAAQILAGSATAVVSILVNGVEVVRTFVYQPPPPGQEAGPAAQEAFQVVVETRDASGAIATRMGWGAAETVWVSAWCVKVGAGHFPAGDPTIQFSASVDPSFVTFTDLGMPGGRRQAAVALVKPKPQGTAPASVVVTVTAGQGGLVSAAVTLSIEQPEYILDIY